MFPSSKNEQTLQISKITKSIVRIISLILPWNYLLSLTFNNNHQLPRSISSVISERFCGEKYLDNKTSIFSYTAYLPTSGQDEAFLEVLSQLSYDIQCNVTRKCIILIGLDTNQSDKSSKRRSGAMKNFKEQLSLNSILLNDLPTFHHNNQTSTSQIDHILYFIPDKSAVNVKLQKHLCKLENFANLSSHDAIVGKIEFPVSADSDYSSPTPHFWS